MNTLETLFRDQLADIHYAEKHILTRLPKMAEAARSPKLKRAFKDHLSETEQHVRRIEEAFQSLDLEPRAARCDAILGLLKEGDDILDEFKDDEGVDAALVCAGQKVEHYEIATYGCLVTWAKQLGHDEAAEILAATLDEEERADTLLSQLAMGDLNREAAHAG